MINYFKATSYKTIFSPVKSIWILCSSQNTALNDWLLMLYIVSLYLKKNQVLEQPHRNQGLQKSILSIHPMCISSLLQIIVNQLALLVIVCEARPELPPTHRMDKESHAESSSSNMHTCCLSHNLHVSSVSCDNSTHTVSKYATLTLF